MVVTGAVSRVCTGIVLLDSRAWKALGALGAGAALPLLGFLLERDGTAPGTGFLGEFEASFTGAVELETSSSCSFEKNSTVSL